MVSFAYPKPGQICNKVGTVMQSIADFPVKKGLYAIGHVRYSTSGGLDFCQPVYAKTNLKGLPCIFPFPTRRSISSAPIDPTTISVNVSANTSPFAGKDGDKLTSRVIRDRLLQEAKTNVSIKIEELGESF